MSTRKFREQEASGYELGTLKQRTTVHIQEPPDRPPNELSQTLLAQTDTKGKGYSSSESHSTHRSSSYVPDWKPPSLRYGPIPTILAIIALLSFYTYCYAQTKIRTYVARSTKTTEIVYRFGPTLIAVVLTEVIQQMVTDLSLIAPFRELPPSNRSKTRKNITKMFTAHTLDYLPKSKGAVVLALACYILIPSQSGVFEKTTVKLSTSTMDMKQVKRSDFIESLNASTFGALAANTVFGSNQGVAPDLAKYRWVWRQSSQESWIGLMPFLPEQSSDHATPSPFVEDIVWGVDTWGISSNLTCYISDFNLSISKLERNNDKYTMTNVSLSILDDDYCTVDMSWPSVTETKLPGMRNPVTPDHHFAFWSTYRYNRMNITFEGQPNNGTKKCPYYMWKSLVIVGPIPRTAGDNLIITQREKDWAVLNCIPGTSYINNPLRYEASQDGTNYKIKRPLNLSVNGTSLNEGRILVDVMETNLLYNDLIYNLTSPGYGKTFWGKNITQLEKFNTAYDLDDSCELGEYTNLDQRKVCELFRLCKDLWDALFAITVSTSAQLVPPEKWSTVSGERKVEGEGWAISTWSYIYTTALYLFIGLYLWFEPSIHRFKRDGLKHRCCHRTQRSKGPTGLYDTPTSIAGLALLIQRKSMRAMFTGVDWMAGDPGMETIEKRLSKANLSLPRDSVPIVLKADRSDRPGHDWADIVAPSTRRPEDLAELLRSAHPWEVGFKILTAVFVVCATLIVVVVKFIVISKTRYFTIWNEDQVYRDGKLPSEGFRAWIQKQIFEGSPVVLLTAVGMWWGMVDVFFRRSQPFASLSKGGDAKIMRLTYMHDFHLQVTWRALRNSHFRLALVTFLTFLSKIAVVFSAGIFSMVTAPSPHRSTDPITHVWRSQVLGDSGANFPTELLQERALSASFSGPLWRSTRNEGTYWYPQLSLNKTKTSAYKIHAIKANMTCASAGLKSVPFVTTFDETDVASNWNLTFSKGECTGLTVPFTCADQDWWLKKTATADSLCIFWSRVNHTECSGIPDDTTSRWLVLAINTVDGPGRSTALSVGEPSHEASALCTPQFYLDELEVTVSRQSDGKSKSERKLLSSKPLSHDHWTQQGNSSLDFVTRSNKLIEDALGDWNFTNSDLQASILGIMTMSEIGSAERLFHEELLGVAASNTYSTAFAALAAVPVTDKGDTLFATAADPTANKVDVRQYVYLAQLDRLPLYVGLGLLCMFLLATPVVRVNRDRKTPRKVKYYVNIMTMMYDSEFVDVIEESGETRGFECLEGRKFAVGLFRGVSGARRIGIDFMENITKVGREKNGSGAGEGLLE